MGKDGKNKNLHSAKTEKNDEFYTQISDIENELRHYKEHFRGKTVFCNCDDPEASNFWKYFSLNFEHLGLKRLITTHYVRGGQSYALEFTPGDKPDLFPADRFKKTMLIGDGDFRSEECVELLRQADIVVTNPPFSLFREYLRQLIDHEKKFIVMGNLNTVTYKEAFGHILTGKIWFGPSISSGDREFEVPEHYPLEAAGFRIGPDGRRYIRVKGVRWFTNLDHAKRHEELILYREFRDQIEAYPKYDNYDAIEVSKVKEIPGDFDGVMGVPITFLDKWNPDQFSILGMSASAGYSPEIVGIPFLGERDARPLIGGKNTYARIFIRRKS